MIEIGVDWVNFRGGRALLKFESVEFGEEALNFV